MNNNCRAIHETIVRDVFDVINDVKDFDEIEWMRRKNNTGSIAKRASNLILVFPVIVSSNSISIQTAMMITKAIERKCVSLLQILFASVQITSANNVQDYIDQFHTNLSLKNGMDLDDFMSIMDKLVAENAIEVTDADAYNAVKEDMHNINYMLSNDFNPVSINDYKMKRNMYGESSIVCEADTPKPKQNRHNSHNSNFYKRMDDEFNKMSKITTDAIRNTYNTARKYGGGNNTPTLKDQTDYFYKQVLSTQDIKKANELMPTTMLVNFTTLRDGIQVNSTAVVGVKAKMYPVDSMEIINRLSSKVKDSNGLFNLVRATTREISFFKDLAFMIDKAKLDAINMASDSTNAKMFRLLERRAAKNKFSSLIRRNDASPITSLVIGQDEVEYLKKYNNINMEKSYVTRTILEAYNLMDIVIADESLEIAKFLFDDGDGVYETLTFDALEKEASDNSYKKVINLMSKINR